MVGAAAGLLDRSAASSFSNCHADWTGELHGLAADTIALIAVREHQQHIATNGQTTGTVSGAVVGHYRFRFVSDFIDLCSTLVDSTQRLGVVAVGYIYKLSCRLLSVISGDRFAARRADGHLSRRKQAFFDSQAHASDVRIAHQSTTVGGAGVQQLTTETTAFDAVAIAYRRIFGILDEAHQSTMRAVATDVARDGHIAGTVAQLEIGGESHDTASMFVAGSDGS